MFVCLFLWNQCIPNLTCYSPLRQPLCSSTFQHINCSSPTHAREHQQRRCKAKVSVAWPWPGSGAPRPPALPPPRAPCPHEALQPSVLLGHVCRHPCSRQYSAGAGRRATHPRAGRVLAATAVLDGAPRRHSPQLIAAQLTPHPPPPTQWKEGGTSMEFLCVIVYLFMLSTVRVKYTRCKISQEDISW